MVSEAGRINTTRAWMQARPVISSSIAATVAFFIGLGAGSGNSLEADLLAAKGELNEVTDQSADEISSLEDENDSLSADLESAESKNESLEQQILKLEARRELPNLTGDSRNAAESLEDEYGWNLVINSRYSTESAGTILSQSPAAGSMMRYGATFKIVVAKPLPKLPSVKGLYQGKATRTLRQAGWTVVTVEQISTETPGTVISMSPSGGSPLQPGSTVTLTIAKKAPPPPPAPSVNTSTSGSGCTPGYSPCLPPASDYDCSGGSGDGPEYTGYVTVTGSDPYGLDSDGDGAGCES